MFSFGGASRTYVVYAPKVKLSKPALVLVLHGLYGDGASIELRTKRTFDTLADRDGFVVAYPDGLAGQWNTGHPGETNSDDVGFLSALIDTLAAEFDVDPKRVYVTGLSKGAAMTYRLACERPNQITAIAPVAGGLSEGLMRSCAEASRRPIPLLVMHGTADPIVPFDSGELEGNVQYWIRRNGCTLTPVVTRLPDIDPADGARTRVDSYGNCKDGADVALYAIEGGGHHWPGGDQPLRGRGNFSRDFDAGVVIWDFFKQHPMP
jgi:polyhydroxybutyrate depolymerase